MSRLPLGRFIAGYFAVILAVAGLGYIYTGSHTPDLKPSYVKLAGCSAAHIGDGLLLTAAHCSGTVSGGQQVLWRSTYHDVMLLRDPAVAGKHAAAHLACRKPRVGEPIEAITFPVFPPMANLGAIHTRGYVAAPPVGWLSWREIVPLNITAAPGSSGGAVYDADGLLLGLVVGGPRPFGGMTVMVPSYLICQMMGRPVA